MNSGQRRPVWAWLVVFVAIGAALGHVCALPHQAHADEVAAATPVQDGHDESDDHAIHSACCEALRTTPAQLTPSVLMSWTIGAELPPLVRQAARFAAPVFRADSPPLFLLHAALLI